jgi:hypothetical protein
LDSVTNDDADPRVANGAGAGFAGWCRMTKMTVRLRLNQQQLELIDNSVKAGESGCREELIRRALREFAKAHLPQPGDNL